MKVVGNPHADGDIQIDGTVEGDIKSRLVTVGETAHIIGSINAESINVRGKVTGQVSAAAMRSARTAKSPASHHRSAQRQAGIRGQGAGDRGGRDGPPALGRLSLRRRLKIARAMSNTQPDLFNRPLKATAPTDWPRLWSAIYAHRKASVQAVLDELSGVLGEEGSTRREIRDRVKARARRVVEGGACEPRCGG